MATILHIAQRAQWEQGLVDGQYETGTLETEGFIHCSAPQQVINIANTWFKETPNLVLLVIEESLVGPPIKYECGGSQDYPHIYGPLNVNAVVGVFDFLPNKEGLFELPPELPS